jgi:hypothetical protein
MIRRNAARLLVLAAVVTASVSCGDVVRDGSSPVYLVIDSLAASRGGPQVGTPSAFLLSDVVTNVTSPDPCSTALPCPRVFGDPGIVTLRLTPRNINTTTGPTANNEVTISRVHVDYIRADGRNVPGVDVPYAFDGAVTATVPVIGSVAVGFELVRSTAKAESPLVQLRTSPNILTVIARVTFYGQDRTGNAVSVTGQIQIDFANFGD